MSAIIFLIAATLFTASIVCGVCYGVALRDYRQLHELGHADKSPICSAAMREAARFLVIGTAAYLLGMVALAGILRPM